MQAEKVDLDSESQLYMYVLVNNDLKMGKGKIAGQVRWDML